MYIKLYTIFITLFTFTAGVAVEAEAGQIRIAELVFGEAEFVVDDVEVLAEALAADLDFGTELTKIFIEESGGRYFLVGTGENSGAKRHIACALNEDVQGNLFLEPDNQKFTCEENNCNDCVIDFNTVSDPECTCDSIGWCVTQITDSASVVEYLENNSLWLSLNEF